MTGPNKAGSETPEGVARRADRRSKPRIELQAEVSMTSDTQPYAGLTGDVSSGGLFVATYAPLAVGTSVDLRFELPTGLVHARGIVRWKREASDGISPGMGVAFEALDADSAACLERFCRSRPPLYVDFE
jgi:uncharacterized protein (TIGR02266 family)